MKINNDPFTDNHDYNRDNRFKCVSPPDQITVIWNEIRVQTLRLKSVNWPQIKSTRSCSPRLISETQFQVGENLNVTRCGKAPCKKDCGCLLAAGVFALIC